MPKSSDVPSVFSKQRSKTSGTSCSYRDLVAESTQAGGIEKRKCSAMVREQVCTASGGSADLSSESQRLLDHQLDAEPMVDCGT